MFSIDRRNLGGSQTIGPARLDWGLLALLSLSVLASLALDDPRRQFQTYAAAITLAGGAWFALFLRRSHLSTRFLRCAIGLAVSFRIIGLFTPPAFSDDAFRYVYEGRVMWERGPAYPFLRPPRAAVEDGVPKELLDESWLRINHASIPTLYPPLSAATFAVAAKLGDALGGRHLLALKILLILSELAALVLLATGGPGQRSSAVVLALCPLLIEEVALEGHHDALALLGLALFARGASAMRPTLAHVGLALASLAKLFALAIHPLALAWSRRGAAVPLFVLGGLLLVPALLGGFEATLGLRTYAEAWRSGDGAFTAVALLTERAFGPEGLAAGSVQLSSEILARGLVGLLFLAFLTRLVRRPERPLLERAQAALVVLLLLSPTFHPWYALWLLPLLPFGRGGAALWLLALAPLFHQAAHRELVEGSWMIAPGLRALVHLPAWILVVRAERFLL
jgi:hypothetical protein